MNIYMKLQKCRVELHNKKLKKTGYNKYSDYNYYELSDFMPAINELMLENNLCSFLQFNKDLATLTIVNSENPEENIVFTSPMSNATLKACHEVQNLGAVETYIRRYLYINAFEVVEVDAIDKGQKQQENKKKPEEEPKDLRKEIGSMLLKMKNNDKELAKCLLMELTTWTNSEGKIIRGYTSLDKISEKSLKPTYGKIKEKYAEYLKENKIGA